MAKIRGPARLILPLLFPLVCLTPAPAASAPSHLRIATDTPGSTLALMATGLAQVIAQKIPNVDAIAQPTGGSAEHTQLVATKRAALGLVPAVPAWEALHGVERFKGNPVPLVTLTPMSSVLLQLITVDGSGVNSIADLRGKRVVIYPPEVHALRVLQAAGIDAERDVRIERPLPFQVADLADAFRSRRIDAFFTFQFVPGPLTSVMWDLAATAGIRAKLVSLDSVVPPLQKAYPGIYYRVTLPRGFYPSMAADVPTVGSPALLVALRDFDTNLAYEITKLVYERRAELAQAHPQFQYVSLIGLTDRSPLPFHPGAARYFRERGVSGF